MRKAALILLVAQIVFFFIQILKYYQTQYQLVSPLIPKDVIATIQQPFVIIAVSIIPLIMISAILFFKKQYRASAVLGCIVVAWAQFGQDILVVFQEHGLL